MERWQEFREILAGYKWSRFLVAWIIVEMAIIFPVRLFVLGVPLWPPVWIWDWWATQASWVMITDITINSVWILGFFAGIWRFIVEIINKARV
jgi:hypothetical protein